MSGYVETIKVKDGDQDKNIKLMFFCVDDEKLLVKYKTIWTKIRDLKIIRLNVVCDDRYIKAKARTYSDNIYANLCS